MIEEVQPRMRRYAMLRVTPELLLEMSKPMTHWARTVKGLPLDARIVSVGKSEHWWFSPDYAAICLVVESETFAEVKEGELLPECGPITWERWDGK